MSVFSAIIAGEIPGRFVWEDETCVAFATIEPIEFGHVLVVPRAEVDNFSQLAPKTFAHLAKVTQIIAKAQEKAFQVSRSIVTIFGFDVPHTHIHVIPSTASTISKIGSEKSAEGAELDSAMKKLRKALCELGYEKFVPAQIDKLKN